MEEDDLALKDDMKFSMRKYPAPYGLEELELQQKDRSWMQQVYCMYPSLNTK